MTWKGNALLKFPLSVIQRADVTRLKPPRDAVEVESVLRMQSAVSDTEM